MAASLRRLTAFAESLPSNLVKQERQLALELARLNASAKVKMRKVHQLIDKFGAATDGKVACKKGCSDCCKMNVTISDIEAAQIADHTGRRAVALKTSQMPDSSKFLGQPCPFLTANECSIYDHRPMACRQHFSFDETAYWCHPSRSLTVELKQLSLSGIDDAYMQILTARGTSHNLADIRDFFPD